jgi:2-polyprenyl-3-methyl-5-hydroxy-6-metoxy-1,4-benzoquinol methylase
MDRPVDTVRWFRGLLQRELDELDTWLSPQSATLVRDYPRTKQLGYPQHRQRWIDHGLAAQVEPVLEIMRPGLQVLDAGCGLGSEAILFGLLGARVTGVDLRAEFVQAARERVRWWADAVMGSLNVRFVRANLLGRDWGGGWDVVFAREALSHIHPRQAFLHLAYAELAPGGRLVVSDANSDNPYMRYKLARMRNGVAFTAVSDPDGRVVTMANEAPVAARGLVAELADLGFTDLRYTTWGFVPIGLVSPGTYALLRWLARRAPRLRLAGLGSRFVVVATRR